MKRANGTSRTRTRWTHWLIRLFTPAPLMPTLPTNSARWSIAPSGLRMSCSKSLAFRATPPSTTPTVRPREPASSSINGSSSARTRTATTCPKRLSAVSIPPSGSPAMSHITPSTMPKTVHLNILAVRVLPQLSVLALGIIRKL